MKLLRACLAVSSLLALCACSSPSRPFQPKINKRPVASAPTAPTPPPAPIAAPAAPVPEPAPAPAPVPEPVAIAATPPPAPEPVAAPAPEPPPAPAVVVAAVTPVVAEPAPALRATRTGSTVTLAWTLPESSEGYRAIEVMRNTTSSAQGRGRIRAVRATVTGIEDTVPDAAAPYWYWLKLTTSINTVTNLGPIEAIEVK